MAKATRSIGGQTVAITGGARGIGRATARALLDRGLRVAIGDVDVATAQRTADELGGEVIALALDVTDRASFSGFLDAVEQRWGTLDILINNAGIMPVGRFIDEDDDTARRMVEINLLGVILGTKLALERMLPRDRGHIVNIASQAGKFGAPGGATYSATKHAVVGLTEAVRGEMRLMGADVQLSYVMPAIVNTELGAGTARTRGVAKLEPEQVAEAIVEALEQGTVDVWVPKSTRAINMAIGLMPRRGAEGVARVIGADRALFAADATARRGYELRAARSAPAVSSTSDAQPPTNGGDAPGEQQSAVSGS
jgi:NADP-dependent 3-hydroxy acid dehydrogenase YdfG